MKSFCLTFRLLSDIILSEVGEYKIKVTYGRREKIAVTVPYNQTYIKDLKRIKGYRWNPGKKRGHKIYKDE